MADSIVVMHFAVNEDEIGSSPVLPAMRNTFIIVRVTKEEKDRLIESSGGARKLSRYLRAKLGINEKESKHGNSEAHTETH